MQQSLKKQRFAATYLIFIINNLYTIVIPIYHISLILILTWILIRTSTAQPKFAESNIWKITRNTSHVMQVVFVSEFFFTSLDMTWVAMARRS